MLSLTLRFAQLEVGGVAMYRLLLWDQAVARSTGQQAGTDEALRNSLLCPGWSTMA